jgi:hypothetical protein
VSTQFKYFFFYFPLSSSVRKSIIFKGKGKGRHRLVYAGTEIRQRKWDVNEEKRNTYNEEDGNNDDMIQFRLMDTCHLKYYLSVNS